MKRCPTSYNRCVCLCVFGGGGGGGVCVKGMSRDHTKTLPGHMSEAGVNGAFWLVSDGCHGNRSMVLLSNCGVSV